MLDCRKRISIEQLALVRFRKRELTRKEKRMAIAHAQNRARFIRRFFTRKQIRRRVYTTRISKIDRLDKLEARVKALEEKLQEKRALR
jgi:hypothetical protein